MILRIARHTENIASIKELYITILELDNLGSFENHDGYDGVFLGKSSEN